jgi:hypothetical protein
MAAAGGVVLLLTADGVLSRSLSVSSRLVIRKRSAKETADRDIFDQAVHMYIVYKLDWGGKLVRLENAKSPVITLAAFGEFKKQSPVRCDFDRLGACVCVCVCVA